MDNQNLKTYKGNISISNLNQKNIFPHQTIKQIVSDISLVSNKQLQINSSNKSNNKINVVKLNQKDFQKHSMKASNIKNEKQKFDKNDLIYKKTIENSNSICNEKAKKVLKKKNLKKNTYYKNINSNKFIRTFSGSGYKRKCSLNNKGTFNTSENKGRKIVARNNSKEKQKYYTGNSLFSNDIETIQEFNTTNVYINNYSYKKNNKYNTIISMTNYRQKDKDKYIKKINNKEEIKTEQKKTKYSKGKSFKPPINIKLKFKEEISINDNKNEIKNDIKNDIKDRKKYCSKKIFEKKVKYNKGGILTNNINSTIDDNANSDKKIIKIHIIDSFRNKNKDDNLKGIKNEETGRGQSKKKNCNSVDNKTSKKEAFNNSIKSNEITNNYFGYNQMINLIDTENNKKVYKINNCLKKSIKKNLNFKLYENPNKKNLKDFKTIVGCSKNKKEKKNNIKEIIINKYNNMKKGTLNLRTVSSNQNLKNEINSYNKYYKINKYNKYFNQNYSTMSNRLKLTLNIVNENSNYNNKIKYSLIKNIKDQFSEENKLNNLLFILNILSNWGNKNYLGMTGIEIFDINNQKIKIKECIVEGGKNEHIERLFNDKIYTTNENDMWITDINNDKDSKNPINNIKLYFYISNYLNLESINNINIWNYNGSELNKSIKKIEILTRDEEIIYYGIVPKGEYNIKCFHPYKIRINKKILSKRNKNKIYRNTHLLYNKYKYDIEPSLDLNYLSLNNNILTKKRTKNVNFTLIKQTSLSNTRKANRFNSINVKSSRSCNKDKNNYSSINHELNKNKNYSENKKYIINKIKTIQKLKNNSFEREKKEMKKYKKEKNKEFHSSQTKLEKNNSLNNIKSFNSFNKHNLNSLNIINDNIKNRISNISSSNNTISLNSRHQNEKSKIQNFLSFKKIRIKILTNYGNPDVVGLTGINLIDKDNKIIDISCADTVGALPKDLKTIFFNVNEYRIFENIFNGINNTIDENLMWLTLINMNPYIEICFKEEKSLRKIEIWNFNEPLGLDKGAKDIQIIFDNDENKKYNIMLWKGLGIDYHNYFQEIHFDNSENTSNVNYLKLKNININNNKLPIGFIFKLIFISNFGDEEMISLNKFELYNEKNDLLSNYTLIHDDYDEKYLNINNSNKSLKNINCKYNQKFFYYHTFFNFKKDEDSICNNLLFICFNEIVQIKYIKLENISNEKMKKTSTKCIQIYCDDILIFEGELNQKGENIILFEEKERKKFNNIININKRKNEKNKYVEKIKGDVYRLININS